MVFFSKHSHRTSLVLTLSIVLFLVLDMSMLALNFKITREVSEDALVINLAGRQRMLSQRMSKLIFQIDDSNFSSINGRRLTAQFIQVYALFNHTLTGLQQGGVVNDAELNQVKINPIESERGQALLKQAMTITDSIRPLVNRINREGLDQQTLMQLNDSLVAHGDVLLDMMNELTVLIEKVSHQKSSRLRMIQLVTFLLAMFNFIIIVGYFRIISRQSQQIVESLNDLLQATNAALIVFDEKGKVVMSNSSACDLFGYDAEDLKGVDHDDLFMDIDGQLIAQTAHDMDVYIELHERQVEQNRQRYTLSTVLDISHHFEREKNLSQLASRDPLTGLSNRAAMKVALTAKIDQVENFGHQFACFFIDLNGFKQINDTYGHDAGDIVLIEFAQRLKNTTRENDLLYRYGGDEFILLVDIFDNRLAIERVAEKIKSSNRNPIQLRDGRNIHIEFSVGVALFPEDARSAEELLSQADRLMYRSKKTHQFEFTQQNIVTGKH